MECWQKMKETEVWNSCAEVWGKERLYGAPVAVVDVETTGLDTSTCRVLQISVVHANLGMGNAEVVYNEYINPGCPIPPETTKIHSITDDMVKSGFGFKDHVTRLRELLRGRILVAYHLPYDYAVLNAEFGRLGLETIPWFGICAKVLACYVDNGKSGKGYHRLENVAKRRGYTFRAHDASEDALVTAKMLDGLLGEASRMAKRKFGLVREYWSFQREEAIKWERGLRLYYNSTGGNWPWTDW